MSLNAVKGTKDIFGEDSIKYDYVIKKASDIFKKFGYNRFITPIFEETKLFSRGIGEGTDIVEKEMYTFIDKGNRSITLRPEGTASIVRAYIQHNLNNLEDLSKIYYHGPMFRYERPQKGRYREFNQVGVEAFGSDSYVLDAETIFMAYKFLMDLGITDIEVQINSVGSPKSRNLYIEKLKMFLSSKYDNLCIDCKNRFEKNPLRILDCKINTCKEETKDAPIILDYLDEETVKHFEEVKKYLEIFNVPFKVNPKLVRGLDYYTNTVFEIVTNKLGAQGTVLAGGRYNNLVKEVGGKDVPAFGFAAGVERIMMLLDKIELDNRLEVAVVWLGEDTKAYAFNIVKELRNNDINAFIELGSKSMKAQMKKVSKFDAKYAIIIGEDEMKSNKVVLKDLDKREQETYSLDEAIEIIKK